MDAQDIISNLPNEVLGRILSFLPTKRAASTSVLSKRWRNVFVLVTNLDFDHLDSERVNAMNAPPNSPPNSRTFSAFVENVLKLQGNSPIKKLSLKCDVGDYRARVQSWICSVVKRGVVDLDLNMWVSPYRMKIYYPVPSLMFKSETLVNLRLACLCKIKISQGVYLPMLRTLCVRNVRFGEDHDDCFETLVSGCPVLEEMELQQLLGVDQALNVSSPSLKRLCLRQVYTVSMTLDVPNLVYLEYWCFFGKKYPKLKLNSLVEARIKMRVSEGPVEEMRQASSFMNDDDTMSLLNAIRSIKVLHLCNDLLELLYFFSSKELPVFDNLVQLCIESKETRGWELLPLLIKNSPNLKALIFEGLNHYITENCGDVCVCRDSKENIPSCLSSCPVKVLEISGYQGTTRELNQMKHFLEKLPCLELVKICAPWSFQVHIDMQKVMALPRASSNCKMQTHIS